MNRKRVPSGICGDAEIHSLYGITFSAPVNCIGKWPNNIARLAPETFLKKPRRTLLGQVV